VSDSFAPPPSPRLGQAPPKRPGYLVVALVLIWLVGLTGWMGGCHDIDTIRHPEAARLATERIADTEMARTQLAFVDALLAHRKTVTPLAVGEFLLGSLLAFAAASALWGRSHGRWLLLQAILAYAAFLGVDYVLSAPIRARQIDAMISDPSLPSLTGHTASELAGVFQAWFVLRIAVLGAALFAVTRSRARAVFAGSKSRNFGAEEP
jgi:hypothetical protein